MSVITVNNVGKAFRTYERGWHRIADWCGFSVRGARDQWVLKDIDFTLAPGEALGLVGENGAGKSTLLKMIAGTMMPTTGNIERRGSVRAILELGMGFHGEFTGRQNALHGLSMIGLSRDEVQALIPAVEAFAEVGDYFDAPFRTYSSGMQMRVTFAVATAVRPDVLIVDEALSVGDAYFQHKSFSRIRDMVDAGTALLLVSHDRGAIQRVCDRVILLENGSVSREGPPQSVMDFYNARLASRHDVSQTVSVSKLADGRIQTRSGNGKATIARVSVVDDDSGFLLKEINVGQRVRLEVDVKINEPLDDLVLGYAIKDRLQHDVFGTNTYHLNKRLSSLNAGDKVSFTFSFDCNVGEGSYSLSIAAHTDANHVAGNYDWKDLAYSFIVTNTQHKQFLGLAWLPPVTEINVAPTKQPGPTNG